MKWAVWENNNIKVRFCRDDNGYIWFCEDDIFTGSPLLQDAINEYLEQDWVYEKKPRREMQYSDGSKVMCCYDDFVWYVAKEIGLDFLVKAVENCEEALRRMDDEKERKSD